MSRESDGDTPTTVFGSISVWSGISLSAVLGSICTRDGDGDDDENEDGDEDGDGESGTSRIGVVEHDDKDEVVGNNDDGDGDRGRGMVVQSKNAGVLAFSACTSAKAGVPGFNCGFGFGLGFACGYG